LKFKRRKRERFTSIYLGFHPLDVKCEPYVARLLLDLFPLIFPIWPKISCWYRKESPMVRWPSSRLEFCLWSGNS
jgi:hypothetical protein